MSINVSCPKCAKAFRVPDDRAGQRFRCAECQAIVTVPATGVDEDLDFEEPEVRTTNRRRLASAPPRQTSPRATEPSPSSNGGGAGTLLLILGGIALLIMVACGGIGWFVFARVREAAEVARDHLDQVEQDMLARQAAAEAEAAFDSGPPHLLFPVTSQPVPALPELGIPFRTTPSGIDLHFVEFASVPGNGSGPGQQMSLRVYRPGGARIPGSTPCVLIAPAGTNLLVGNAMDADDYHDETLPYAEAGMVVIFYSLDGPVDMTTASDADVQAAYLKFRAACAGVVNARNAFEFAIARIPEVDPSRIYTAGHSSAGTVSLLMAEHDPRVAGCIAFAPCTDVAAFHGSNIQDPSLAALLPRLGDFVVQSSPMTHAGNLHCPTFLFQAADDSVVAANETRAFKALLEAHGTPVTYEEVASGEHYDSMIQAGIPSAIRWIQSR